MSFRSLLLGTLLSLSLCGCVPLVFVAGATIGGSIIYDHRSLSTINHDATIANQITDKINSQPEDVRKQCNITVNVFNGVVLLAGQVPNEALSMQFTDYAKGLKHVRRVYNRLSVQPAISLTKKTDDVWLLGKIRTALLLKKDLRSTQISVVVENKIAYLMGVVTRQQADLAIQATRQVTGVRKVVTLFEVMP